VTATATASTTATSTPIFSPSDIPEPVTIEMLAHVVRCFPCLNASVLLGVTKATSSKRSSPTSATAPQVEAIATTRLPTNYHRRHLSATFSRCQTIVYRGFPLSCWLKGIQSFVDVEMHFALTMVSEVAQHNSTRAADPLETTMSLPRVCASPLV
jgi:hypothetical protein